MSAEEDVRVVQGALHRLGAGRWNPALARLKARIAELEGALREYVEANDGYRTGLHDQPELTEAALTRLRALAPDEEGATE